MCPICIATAAWIAAGVTSTGGISALAVNTFRKNQRPTTDNRNHPDAHGDREGVAAKTLQENRYVACRGNAQ